MWAIDLNITSDLAPLGEVRFCLILLAWLIGACAAWVTVKIIKEF